MHEVPIVVIDANDGLAAEFAILENIQREDLNPIEEANGLELLMEKFDYTQDKLSEMIGKSRVHISNTLRLKKLPQKIRDLVISGSLSAGHARSLIDTKNPMQIVNTILNKNLNISLVKSSKGKLKQNHIKNKDSNTRDLERSISMKTGMVVSIKNSKKNHGMISIKYKNLDELDRLIKIIKNNY